MLQAGKPFGAVAHGGNHGRCVTVGSADGRCFKPGNPSNALPPQRTASPRPRCFTNALAWLYKQSPFAPRDLPARSQSSVFAKRGKPGALDSPPTRT
ncbi:MAG: hypothetical protein KME31_23000 [Tolypothrix carrinoi HA7290-LM1]|nr:hypothetical protein [Tolypothrix carrinoi HA7290-LM1]